ncbi:hypothetical protein ASD45_14980 [Pseudolabrys sp. Root1462]|nr:hypothetical protein ASD45_14980 [Pseudolabrys sp. Root1462]
MEDITAVISDQFGTDGNLKKQVSDRLHYLVAYARACTSLPGIDRGCGHASEWRDFSKCFVDVR